MSLEHNLPFERGDTYFGLGAGDAIDSTEATAAFKSMAGKEYTVFDPDYPALPVTLKVVQYNGSGDLTADARCVDYSDANFTTFSDLAPGTAGDVSHPLDHKYEGKTIRDLDLCYVVVRGPCEVEGGATVSAGLNVAADTDGQVIASIAGHAYSVGILIDDASAAANGTILVGASNKTGA